MPATTETPGAREAPQIVCTLPTYEEVENVLPLSERLLALDPNLQVLVIDDDSPDGTWKVVQEASETEPRLHLLHRTTQRGRGHAGREGFVRALEMGADVVIEMDADFSHDPGDIPALIERLDEPGKEVGLVLGSRGAPGGKDAERGLVRRWITLLANAYIRTVLGVGVRDCNSGFRCWRRSTLEAIHVEDTQAPGPAIVQELLYKTARAGIGIAEVPIQFRNRAAGESTLTLKTLLTGYTTVLKLRLQGMRGKL